MQNMHNNMQNMSFQDNILILAEKYKIYNKICIICKIRNPKKYSEYALPLCWCCTCQHIWMPDIESDMEPDIDSVHADIGIPDIDPDFEPDIKYLISDILSWCTDIQVGSDLISGSIMMPSPGSSPPGIR